MASEAQRRANANWRKRNKEKVSEYNRNRYANDAEFRERRKEMSRKYYDNLDDAAKRKRLDRCMERYNTDEEYRDRVKKSSLESYYRRKGNKDV